VFLLQYKTIRILEDAHVVAMVGADQLARAPTDDLIMTFTDELLETAIEINESALFILDEYQIGNRHEYRFVKVIGHLEPTHLVLEELPQIPVQGAILVRTPPCDYQSDQKHDAGDDKETRE
jgi:hypothetical protein